LAPTPGGVIKVAFPTGLLRELVPSLALNRGNLVVFIHPVSRDDIADHRDYALWLGGKLNLALEALAATDELERCGGLNSKSDRF